MSHPGAQNEQRARWLGIDVGGANLKIASCNATSQNPRPAQATSVPFPMWTDSDRLASALESLIKPFSSESSAPIHLAITMTGELADCFDNKRDGVVSIVEAIEHASTSLGVSETRYYSVEGRWLSSDTAKNKWLGVAAANWAAMANFVALKLQSEFQSGYLIDIGSTTADIIPFRDGMQIATGKTDTTRLANGELVYAGVGRTSIAMLIDEVQFESQAVPVARENFSTIKDALLILGHFGENPSDCQTANGKPLTIVNSKQRLARTICADVEELGQTELRLIAQQTLNATKSVMAKALEHVVARNRCDLNFVISGEGEWLASEIVNEMFDHCTLFSLSENTSSELSRSGPAHAVAWLANEELRP